MSFYRLTQAQNSDKTILETFGDSPNYCEESQWQRTLGAKHDRHKDP
jgi:hypothetical protein